MSETAAVATYVDAETQVVTASNGVDYAYRDTGASDATPLVALQHFRGNLDNWDPALIDALARGRRVITFDNRGVAASSGTTPRHDRADGARRDRLHRCAGGRTRSICSDSRLAASWPRRSRSFARGRAQGGARVFGSAGSQRNARLGRGRHRRRRQARDLGRGVPERLLHRLGRQPRGRTSRSSAAYSGRARSTATRRPAGRPGWRSTTPYARGDSRTTPCSSGSRRSTSPCSSPTATVTR